MLEEAEEEHDFVGSVMVSAKDGDGSADDAIQSLVRWRSQFVLIYLWNFEDLDQSKWYEEDGFQNQH